MSLGPHLQLPGTVVRGGTGRRSWAHKPVTWRRRDRVRTAFVLAGGGTRGAAQVGMLRALTEWEIVPDAVYGSSVGAVNAAGFAGSPDVTGVETMASVWRRLRRDDVFPQGRIPAPWRFFQTREAVHTNDGLRRVVEGSLAYEHIEDAPVHLEVVATSLTDGQVRWLSRGPVVEAVLASAALPALFPPVTIDGEALIDGGVVDNVPIGRAIDHGARRVFVLLCGPLHYTPTPYRRPVEAVLTGLFIAVHARFARELQAVPPGVEVVVFTVDTQPVSRYDDFSATDALIEAGRRNADAVLAHWAGGHSGDAPAVVIPEPPTPTTTVTGAAGPRVAAVASARRWAERVGRTVTQQDRRDRRDPDHVERTPEQARDAGTGMIPVDDPYRHTPGDLGMVPPDGEPGSSMTPAGEERA